MSYYHSDYSAVSKSMLSQFMDRRSVYCLKYVTRVMAAEQATKVMDLGTVVHAALLEPHRQVVVTYPPEVLGKDGRLGTTAASMFAEQARYGGLIPLKEQDAERAACMVASVRSVVGDILAIPTGKREAPIRWTDEESGLQCKCRPDFLAPSARVILDIKTTSNVVPWEFERQARELKYWLQDAHYCNGAAAIYGGEWRFLFVAVESEPPHETIVYEYSPERRADADVQRSDALSALKQCYESGDWRDAWMDGEAKILNKPLRRF